MLTVETIGRIRREYFVQVKTIKENARDLQVWRNTVQQGRALGHDAFLWLGNPL